ncbi:MAG: DNA-formamidopyrimidine glycosylase [Candidatus Magasanikbacteria bacterium]
MPELPEVETIRRDLEDKILNKRIDSVEIRKDSAIKKDKERFKSHIKEDSFSGVDRQGKLLNFKLNNSEYEILSHLRMTGKLIFDPSGEEVLDFPGKHTGVIFNFEDNSELYFDDVRTFGYMQLLKPKKKKEILAEKLGIEPLTEGFTLENFKEVLKSRRTNVKNILMKQKAIAGIGNIYADEICHESGVRPDRNIPELSENEIKNIFNKSEQVIKQAIHDRGTTFRDYVDSSGKKGNFARKLKVYGREGEQCKDCNEVIKKIKLNGRGTHFCINCQK